MNIKKYYNIAKTKLFPITRSLTGDGVKKTLNIIQKELPKLKIKVLNIFRNLLLNNLFIVLPPLSFQAI